MSTPRGSPRVTRSTASRHLTENLNARMDERMDDETDSEGSESEDDERKNERLLEKLKKSPYLRHAPKLECNRPSDYTDSSAPKIPPLPTSLKRPPLAPRQTEEAKKSDQKSTSIMPFIVALLAIVVSVCFFLYRRQPDLPSEAPTITFNQAFEEQLAKLKLAYPNQSTSTWRTIRAAVLPAGLDPRSPGVVAVLGTERSLDTAACMTAALAHAIMVAYNDTGYVRLNGANYKDRRHDAAGVKKELDGVIRSSLGSAGDQQHVVLIERVDLLPAKSGLLFHGLCDNEFAPFKRAVYIFTSRLGEKGAAGKLVDMQVTGAWEGHLEEDQRSSIESRIGNHIVNIVSEPTDALRGICR